MVTRFTVVLQRHDDQPLGTFRQVRKVLRGLFPNVRFGWASSGSEMLQGMLAKGFEIPEVMRRELEGIRSTLEGGVTRVGQLWEFSLGLAEPVVRLYVNVVSLEENVTERSERDQLIKALESAFDAESTPTNSWPGRGVT